jgi:hypothetical protein
MNEEAYCNGYGMDLWIRSDQIWDMKLQMRSANVWDMTLLTIVTGANLWLEEQQDTKAPIINPATCHQC